MRPTQAPTIRLSEYQQPAFWIKTVNLHFTLHPTATRVRSTIEFSANDTRTDGPHDLRLHGQDLKLISASINGNTLKTDEILIDAEGLTIPSDLIPQNGFTWEAEVEINPEANTSLNGLYMSNGMYCTQCEAEGFRKITFYPDRPDVMACFTVRIESKLPVLLSNGNPSAQGEGWVEWHDPWPKPAYLFALVAGNLVNHADRFTTQSGNDVDLNIWVRPGDEDKCSLRNGRSKTIYALGRRNLWPRIRSRPVYATAVDDFNMGAMENKGLNIFNSSCVPARPKRPQTVITS